MQALPCGRGNAFAHPRRLSAVASLVKANDLLMGSVSVKAPTGPYKLLVESPGFSHQASSSPPQALPLIISRKHGENRVLKD